MLVKKANFLPTPNTSALKVNYGFDQMTAQNYRQPFLSYVLNRTVTLKGSSILNDQDLQRFYGHKAVDSDNYLTNFVIEVYLHLIASKGMAKGMKVQVLRGNRVTCLKVVVRSCIKQKTLYVNHFEHL